MNWRLALHGLWVLPIIAWLARNWWRLHSSEKIILLISDALANLTNLVLLPGLSHWRCYQ